MPNFILKSARETDWPAMIAIHRRARKSELGLAEDASIPAALPDLEATLPGFDGFIWLAQGMNQLFGFVAVRGKEIVWLYVDPDYHRAGVGRALLRFAMTKCGRGVHATMIAGNAPALALYRSLGFNLVSSDTVTVPGFFAPKSSWRLECHDLRYPLSPGEDR
ncbi:GNAT family N-acetyltransferase [Sphingomonas fennica]|nr:GNAT family N-acetyltransferase [Sphingomonas fennica]